ncbi:MAG: hypothetical protein WD425_06065 [Nitrospirales bacterium]
MPAFSTFRLAHRFDSQDVRILCILVVLSLGSWGCSESETPSPQTEVEESPSTAVPVTPASPEPLSEFQAEESDVSDKREIESGASTPPDSIQSTAQEQLAQARLAVGEADRLLQRAPTGKGSDLALSALRLEFDSARALLQAGQAHYDDQQFDLAKDKAQEAEKKAKMVAGQIEQAMESVKRTPRS